MAKEKLRWAKNYKCIMDCGRKAVCFWPMVDPDIRENPYCRKCVEEAKFRVLTEIFKKEKNK